MPPFPYQDPSLELPLRIIDLLDRMSLAEKIGQMVQLDVRITPEKFIREFHVGSFANCLDPDEINHLQSIASRETRLGIPLLFGADAIHGHAFWPGATVFPTQIGLASTWNPALAGRVAHITALEMSITGTHQAYSPVLCLARDVRWGRVGETFGEDPYLAGVLGQAMILGYQGNDLSQSESVLACCKHFIGYGETQGGRDGSEAEHTPRKILSLFAPPFEKAIRSGCGSVMMAYQAIDGQPCVTNPWLTNQLLRADWGFGGFIQTDYNNADALVELRRVASDYSTAYAMVINAGVDLLNCTPRFLELGEALVNTGLIATDRIDEACGRILKAKFELGLFDQSEKCFVRPEKIERWMACAEHRAVALEAARESLVLLKNDGILPLDLSELQTIALIGPNADDITAQLGDWSFGTVQGGWSLPREHPRQPIQTVLDGLRVALPGDIELLYTPGCSALPPRLANRNKQEELQIPKFAFERVPSDVDAAVRIAHQSDVVIAVVGDCLPLNGEIRDRANLDLTGDQQKLLEALKATGKPLVVILITSKPLTIPWVEDNASAILLAWNPGMQGGTAVAEAILGTINPSGKLPISWPRHIGQQPVAYNQAPGWQGKPSYVDFDPDPLYAFGFGGSYTSFEIGDLVLQQHSLTMFDTLEFSVTIRNIGARAGAETVQVYSRDMVSSLTTPTKQLQAFQKVYLQPGEEGILRFFLEASRFWLIDHHLEKRVEPGEFELMVGASSRDDGFLRDRFTIQE